MGCGVFRLLDTDGDDKFDKLVKLKFLGDTAGERPSCHRSRPRRQALMRRHRKSDESPDGLHPFTGARSLGEDQLLPSLQHFMKGAEAPLTASRQIDPEGKTWEIVATGFESV